ncbi:MAG: S41 family peptidase [Cyclobacteriaceae bacterium]
MHYLITLLYSSLYLLTQVQPVAISTEEQKEDINVLHTNLEKYHPGLYRYTTKDSIDLAFSRAKTRITSQPLACFYAEITQLLSKVRCGHTRSYSPVAMDEAFTQNELFFPASIKYLDGKVYINEVFMPKTQLRTGVEVVAINDRSIEEINFILFSHLPSDGFITTGKRKMIERRFSLYYQLYVDSGTKEYELQLRNLNGELQCITIAGTSWDQLEPTQNKQLPLSISFHSDYALLDIRTFDSRTISQSEQDYYDFLESSFSELKQKNVKNLIMDLRGNGGGDDNYGATLVSYFAKDSFRYFEHIEVTDNYDGYGKVNLKNGRRLMTSHKGLDVWQPQANGFTGNVYVLIDGFSFSTCADVATVMHHHQLATFIGEETGGGYDGNTSGNSKSLVLPNSGIRINVPMWKYTTANIGHPYHGRGVMPDYPVEQTRKELLENKDAVMAKALQLMQHP